MPDSIEPLAALAICLSDWGCAASHMAFAQIRLKEGYAAPVRLFGDRWHVVAGLRYIGLTGLAVACFDTWEWYVITAVVNSLGWYILKRLHGKDWGWKPTWMKEIL